MSRTANLSIAAISLTLFAGCAHVTEPKQATTAPVANDPNVVNAQRLVSGLTSLTDTTERMKASKLRIPHELCFGTLVQASMLTSRAIDAMNFYNAAPSANQLYASNLQKRVANIDLVFGDLAKLCPRESKALGAPTKLELVAVPGTKQLRLAVND